MDAAGVRKKNSGKAKKDGGVSNPDLMEEEDAWLGKLATTLPKVSSSNGLSAQTQGRAAPSESSGGKSSGKQASRPKKQSKKPATESKDVSDFFTNLMTSKK